MTSSLARAAIPAQSALFLRAITAEQRAQMPAKLDHAMIN
jgi:hypothetical protein